MDNLQEVQFAGVKNTSGGATKATHGGRSILFEKDEVKVLEAGLVQFLLSRNILSTDGKLVTRKYLFQSVPLAEALKHVKAPENKSVAAAKKEAEAEEKKEALLRAKIIAELKAEGLIVASPKKP